MEQDSALKQAESSLSLMADKSSSMQGKLEDLIFRAQRIANSLKNNMKNTDYMFGYDLQNFRREVRTFSMELSGVPTLLGTLERTSVFSETSVGRAKAIMRAAERLNRMIHSLHDMSLLAHSHIRQAEHKVEAWYLVQEVEQMAQKSQGLPMTANKVLIRISTPGLEPQSDSGNKDP